jgi:AcrR family transcriptional regulator
MKTATRSYHQSARAESTEATGRRIVDAFLARLMVQWFDEITLDRVAEEAGVTVQTVLRRFDGKEGLLGSAVKVFAEQVNAQRATPSGDLDRLVENLLGDYERTGDAVIRLLSLEERHPALEPVLELGRSEHRRWVSRAFAEPLRNLKPPARQHALDALVIITDVYTWKLLRRDMGRSVAETAATLKILIQPITAQTQTNNLKTTTKGQQ